MKTSRTNDTTSTSGAHHLAAYRFPPKRSGNPKGRPKTKLPTQEDIIRSLWSLLVKSAAPSTGAAAVAKLLLETVAPDELTAPEAPASAGPSNAIPKRARRELEALLTRDPDPELDELDPVIAAAGVTQTTV